VTDWVAQVYGGASLLARLTIKPGSRQSQTVLIEPQCRKRRFPVRARPLLLVLDL